MSADDSGSYLSHTLGYAYDPQDQVTQVTTDGTATESYAHDAEGDVTAQTVGGTATSYDYVLGRLEAATAGGATADYNYDPLGRLDTVTAGSQTLQSNTWDGFDNLTATSQLNASNGSMDTTSYTYDSLNRRASQTTIGTGTTSFSYLGTSSEVASEQDPGGTSKTYDYTPAGARLTQDTTTSGGSSSYGYYSYNSHSDVEALTGSSGTTTATYGYTAYGNPVPSMFTGADKNDATPSSSSTTQPYSAYRFNAMRWDGTSGSYDMGFRNYDPGLNQFMSRDMYNGATADMGLTADPFTGSPYAFGDGNPISNIESDGHMACAGPGTSDCSVQGGPQMASASVSCLGPVLSCSSPSFINVPAGSGSGSTGSGNPQYSVGGTSINAPSWSALQKAISSAKNAISNGTGYYWEGEVGLPVNSNDPGVQSAIANSICESHSSWCPQSSNSNPGSFKSVVNMILGMVALGGVGEAGGDPLEADPVAAGDARGGASSLGDAESFVKAFKANPSGGAIRPTRSLAGATWDINGASGEGVAVSGRAPRAGTLGMPTNPIFTATRGFDAEQKVLENLAQGLPLDSTGTVNLYVSPGSTVDPSEPICPSCQGVISQFQQRFPGITLNVSSG